MFIMKMKKETIMRNTMKSLAILLVSGTLFSASAMAEESLSQKAGQAWDSASQSAEDLGKQAEQKFDGAVKDASLLVDDSTITAKIRGQLLSADGIDSNDIAVKTINGTVYLSGFVTTDAQRTKIIDIAKGVPGVRAVEVSIGQYK
ncbi:BON domain-containing protein [Morganella morganii subsp. morganii]|nr:BON domain-containing protein [Morganella morganii]MBT0461864.1 BON domain-containing protein [Morganella morganii subsp. morganii]MBT0519566.1 BON domain-containing protein [Morganella morganii subsp. morganii]QWL91599.1 BON domain-containing protein [Morganella morganii subsp. morganii]